MIDCHTNGGQASQGSWELHCRPAVHWSPGEWRDYYISSASHVCILVLSGDCPSLLPPDLSPGKQTIFSPSGWRSGLARGRVDVKISWLTLRLGHHPRPCVAFTALYDIVNVFIRIQTPQSVTLETSWTTCENLPARCQHVAITLPFVLYICFSSTTDNCEHQIYCADQGDKSDSSTSPTTMTTKYEKKSVDRWYGSNSKITIKGGMIAEDWWLALDMFRPRVSDYWREHQWRSLLSALLEEKSRYQIHFSQDCWQWQRMQVQEEKKYFMTFASRSFFRCYLTASTVGSTRENYESGECRIVN